MNTIPYRLFPFSALTELEGELVVDESQPFSTPSGYSVNMAPGSGLTNAYNRTAANPQTTTAQVCISNALRRFFLLLLLLLLLRGATVPA